MRFAYIDTRGNEVTIPSVDALRLRIELGAILDETQFHDANTGKWAPAMEHEIFRTLKRELEELDAGGFAPPPPGVEGAPAGPEVEAPGTEAVAGTAEPLQAAEPSGTAEPLEAAEPSEPVAPDTGPADDDFGLGMELDLAPEGVERDGEGLPASGGYTVEGGPGEDILDGLGGIELAGEWDEAGGDAGDVGDAGPEPTISDASTGVDAPGGDAPAAGLSPDPAGGDASSDRVADGLADGLDDLGLGDEAPSGPPERFAMSPQEDLMGSVPEPGLMGDADTMGTPEDLASMSLEPTLDEAYEDDAGGFSGDAGLGGDMGALELETPLSEYEADQPPAWTQESTPEAAGTTPDDGLGAAGGGDWDQGGDTWGEDSSSTWEEGQSPTWDDPPADDWDNRDIPPPARGEPPARPASRPRNAPPQRKLTRARTPGAGRVLLLLVAIAAIGGGGWYGYQTFVAGGAAGGGPGTPLPAIPGALMPQMREFSDRAMTRMVEEIAQLPERTSIPDRPDSDWLTGPYLAAASDYASIVDYWSAVADYLSAAEAAASGAYTDALEAEIQGAGLSDADAELIRTRALAGWDASAQDRALVFGQLRSVTQTALDLHEFLVQNEAQIEYRPVAANASVDARLEASAASEQVGEALRAGVDAVTDALDDLGYLDTIQTDGLLNTFLGNLEATPVR